MPARPRTGDAVVLGEHFDAGADALDDRRADEDAGEVAVGEAAHGERRLERLALAAVAVAAHRDVEDAERRWSGRPSMTSVAHRMSPAQVANAGRPSREPRVSGSRSSDESSSLSIVVDSPPGRKIASTPSRCSGRLTSATSAPSALERLSVLAERALQRENPDLHLAASASWRGHQPRSASFTSSVPISSPRIASPRPRETLATMSASS